MNKIICLLLLFSLFISRADTTTFIFPLKYTGKNQDFFGISNFVDHAEDKTVVDYTCQSISYDGHKGTDYFLWPYEWEKVAKNEVHVIAASEGIITEKIDGNSDESCGDNDADSSDLKWNMITVKHHDGSIAIYGHLKKKSLTSKRVGQKVKAGEFLGVVGSSGRSSRPHLHFEVYDSKGNLVDPYSGKCNHKNKRSWWIGSQFNRKAKINLLATHDVEPNVGDCQNKRVSPNFKNQFELGDKVYFAAYFTHQKVNTKASYRIVKPNGVVFKYWENRFEKNFNASYWYNSFELPQKTELGEWSFMARYQGKSYTHSFIVYDSSLLLEKIN